MTLQTLLLVGVASLIASHVLAADAPYAGRKRARSRHSPMTISPRCGRVRAWGWQKLPS